MYRKLSEHSDAKEVFNQIVQITNLATEFLSNQTYDILKSSQIKITNNRFLQDFILSQGSFTSYCI